MIVIPKQHGAWTILLASCIIGIIAGVKTGGRIGAELILSLTAVISGFLLRHAIAVFLKSGRPPRWVVIYFLMSVLPFMTLVFHYDRALFMYFGIIAAAAMLASLVMERMKLDRTLGGEIIGTCALSLAAPAVFYAISGRASSEAVSLWLLSAAFFGANLIFVRYALRHSDFSTRQVGYTAVAFTVIFVAIVAAVFTTL